MDELTAEEQAILENGEETPAEVQEEVVEETPETPEVAEAVEEQQSPKKDPIEVELEKMKIALRETRDERNEFKQKLSAVEELKQQILELKKSKEPEETFDDDPLGYTQKKLEETTSKVEATNLKLQQIEEQTKLVNYVNSLESEFKSKNIDYEQAKNFLKDKRIEELKIYGLEEEQIAGELQQNFGNLVYTALNNKKNPAEIIYQLAKQQGFKPEAAKVENKPNVFDTIQKGQDKAGKTLSGGGEVDTNPSVESLLKANGEDFDKQWKQMFG